MNKGRSMDRPFSIQARFVSKHMRHVQEDNDDDRHAEHISDDTLHGTLHWLRAENARKAKLVPLGKVGYGLVSSRSNASRIRRW